MKKFLFLLCITSALALQSCKLFQPVIIVPPYSAAIVQDVTDLGKQVDAMYITMEQSTDKVFTTYISEYTNAETLINSIIARDQARQRSAAIVKQAVMYRDLFISYRDEHKVKIKINDSEIRVYKKYLKDLLSPLLASEMSLK